MRFVCAVKKNIIRIFAICLLLSSVSLALSISVNDSDVRCNDAGICETLKITIVNEVPRLVYVKITATPGLTDFGIFSKLQDSKFIVNNFTLPATSYTFTITPRVTPFSIGKYNVTLYDANTNAMLFNLDPWWNTSCDYKKQVNYSNSWNDETLTDFPFLVVLNDSIINYSEDSFDYLQFYSSDGKLLPKELELWNTTGNSYLWLKDNITSGAGDYFDMYYSCDTPSGNNATDVWSPYYSAVYHYTNATKDSSRNLNHLTVGAGAPTQTSNTSGIGYEYLFDGNDYLVNSTAAAIPTAAGDRTLTSYVRQITQGSHQALIGLGTSSASGTYFVQAITDSNVLAIWFVAQDHISTQGHTANTWNVLTATLSNSGAVSKIYMNGELVSTKSDHSGVNTGNSGIRIAQRNDVDMYFNGYISESRIETAARSAKWINATYLSLNNRFLSYGVEEQYTYTGNDVYLAYPADGSSNTSTSIHFGYIPNFTNSRIINCSLYVNNTFAKANTTAVVNNSLNDIYHNLSNFGIYPWFVSCWNTTYPANSSAWTINTDVTVTAISPTGVSVGNVTFNYSISNLNETNALSSSIWSNYTGAWALLKSNASKIVNGTNTENYSFTVSNNIVWGVRLNLSDNTVRWTENKTLILDISPPELIVTYNTSALGWRFNLTETASFNVTDDLPIICNFSINGLLVDTNVNATGNISNYEFNLSDGYNNFTALCYDNIGNKLNRTISNYTYAKMLHLVVEDTGENMTDTNFQNVTIRAISEDTDDIFIFDNASGALDNYTWVYYVYPTSDTLRVEKTYGAYPTDLLYIDLNLGLIPYTTRVCVPETQQFYSTRIYSASEQPVIVKNNLADCYVVASYTRYAYGADFDARLYTIAALYYMYGWDDGLTFIATLDGGNLAEIALDIIYFAQREYDYTLQTESMAVSKTDLDVFTFYYFNPDADNIQLYLELYDGNDLLWDVLDTVSPNNFTYIWNASGVTFNSTLLKLVWTTTNAGGNEDSSFLLFTPQGQTAMLHPSVALALAGVIVFFTLTFVSVNYAFGYFGIFTLITALIITTLTFPTKEIRLLQGAIFVLLVFIVLLFMKQENRVIT